MRFKLARSPFRYGVALLCGLVAAVVIALNQRAFAPVQGGADASLLRLENIPFDGMRAYEYVQQLCAIGPRRSGSPGMATQQRLLVEYFQKLGGEVRLQQFRSADPRDGSPVAMANLIVHWHPQRRERILLCAHYDTLPYPLLDRNDPHGVFVGANDGASGVAVLMELGRHMAGLGGKCGVDFVLFDGEEYVFGWGDRYFLGSEYFARDYRDNPPPYRYRSAVLLDMVGDADLQIYQERNSMWWGDSRPVVEEIWATAKRLGVQEFIARKKHEVRDDHLPLHNIAGIPAVDIIDFDYAPWHTRSDLPERCSPLSLAKVGWVIQQWLADACADAPGDARGAGGDRRLSR